jgi:hypothetical protein
VDVIRTTQDWSQATLQTAVIELRQRETGRRVTLIGMIHVALASYYDTVNGLIASHEASGGVVLFEGLGSLTEEEVNQLAPRERTIYRALVPLHALYTAFADRLGLAFQEKAVRYDREHWVNADLPLRELLRRWADSGAPLLPLGDLAPNKLTMPEGAFSRGLTGFMLLQTPLMLSAVTHLRGWVRPLARLSELLISDRNRAALDALEATDAKRDALILYGAGHLPELIEGLERRGYAELSRRWLTAYQQPAPWRGILSAVEEFASGASRR